MSESGWSDRSECSFYGHFSGVPPIQAMARNLLQTSSVGNMNTNMRSLTLAPPSEERPLHGIAWVLKLLLLSGLILLGTELRAETSKGNASNLLTQDKAELERQMAATEQRLTNTLESLNQRQVAGSAVSEGMLWLAAVFLIIGSL